MAHISLRLSEEEKKLMENYANWLGVSLSEAIKAVFFEKLEEEYDLRIIAEYEAAEKEGKIAYKTFTQVVNDLGFEDEI